MTGQMKLKLLYIKDYLEKYSDKDRPIGADELLAMLRSHGLEIERKSVYADVKTMKQMGMKIKFVRHPAAGYYITEREFKPSELRFIMDTLRASGSLSQSDTDLLIRKLGSLCNEIQFAQIKDEVFVQQNFKPKDNSVIENIEILNVAIKTSKKVTFSYTRKAISSDGTKIRSKTGHYTISPYGLIVSNDHYYVIGYCDKHSSVCQYRVDKMKVVEILDTACVDFKTVTKYTDRFDVQDYAKTLFHMFSGEILPVEIVCSNEIIDPVFDHFGSDAEYVVYDEDHFKLKFEGSVSEGLAAWIMGYGDKINVLQPAELKDLVIKRANDVLKMYSIG